MTTPHAARVPFEPGAIIAGRYRILSLIGVGGLGRVYLARHIELETDVAIKVLRPEMAERPEAVHRFAREAQASVRLRSERIARVSDVGTHEGTPFFVMEYLIGCDLLQLRQQESVDIPMLCEFFIQACEGLAEAHAQGVVHRDIKPDNLFVVRDASGWRTLKIFDFGISKVSLTGKYSDVDIAARRTELTMGTPHYISPEQIRSTRDVDHRTDIWSLGVVMFEVLSGGILPFREDREVTALIAEVLEEPHRSLLDVAPNVPEALSNIVDRCLAKDREQRYQTAAEVAIDLLPLAPARARASAERAVAAMQVAGLMAINADLSSQRPSQNPAPERARTLPPAKTTSSPPRSIAPAEPVLVVEEQYPGNNRRRNRIVLAAVLGLIALLVVISRFRSNDPEMANARPAPVIVATQKLPTPVATVPAPPQEEPALVAAPKPVSSAKTSTPTQHASGPKWSGTAPPAAMTRSAGSGPAQPSVRPPPSLSANRLDVNRER